MLYLRIIFIFLISFLGIQSLSAKLGGFNLTEIGEHVYAVAAPGAEKTPLQKNIDRLADLGVKHIILNPRAFMRSPYSSELIPATEPKDRRDERKRYRGLIRYIHSQGMSVGIRPIFFVVDENGNPYVETRPDGTQKLWWHGNIQPSDPDKWFESFRTYLDSYLLIAKLTRVEEFTIGAELYSMTVGIEDQWQKHPHGFPGRWLELLRYVRSKLGEKTRVMYDINFTDAKDNSDGFGLAGGELVRWHYRLVELADPIDPQEFAIWSQLVQFWQELDAIGIDMYRSLTSSNTLIPKNQPALVDLLTDTATRYATQVDNLLAEIEFITEKDSAIYLKEIGYRSIERGFYEPFGWDNQERDLKLNVMHQAAAYDAIFNAFWGAQWPWFKGVNFWDISADPSRHGAKDKGFSPLGKAETENVLMKWLLE